MSSIRHAVALSSTFAMASGATLKTVAFTTNDKNRPVSKVVHLLEDMKEQLEGELADDKAVHKQIDCWCEENDKDKTQAIEVNEARVNELESFIGEAAGRMKEMTVKRNAARDEADRDFDALEKARTLRMKENREFHANEANLIEAVKACDQALTVLKEYHPDAAGLSQVRAVAQRLQAAQVLSISKRSLLSIAPDQLLVLKSFIQDAGGSFLQIPGYQSYGAQSGQIFGVLEEMKADFERDLAEAQGKEKKDVEEFEAVKTAKDDEIATGRNLVSNLDGQIAALKAKHAEAFKELEETEDQLADDRAFLERLKKKCAESEAEFQQRVADRSEEIAAVTETISILSDDDAFENFDATLNSFLQTSATEQESKQQRAAITRMIASLKRASVELQAPALMFLATQAQRDAFSKVKQAIDKMVAELSKQQQDEVEHRDWCIEEMTTNTRANKAADDKQTSLSAKITDLEKAMAEFSKEIKTNVAAIAEMQKQMKDASEVREAENKDFQQTINDHRVTQIILQKALERMQEVYAFIQAQPGAPHTQTSGTATDPGNGPARFTGYSTNAGGSRVVTMLETIIKDSVKLENEALVAEQSAANIYQNFMKDSNQAIALAEKKIMTMKKAKAGAESDHSQAKGDLSMTMTQLEELNTQMGDLKLNCDFVLKNFGTRQEARDGEIQALKEAKAILSGAK